MNPAHIAEAERIGMPEGKIETHRCRQCDAKGAEDGDKCDECGRECCPKCWFWIPSIALRFCGRDCAITRLLKLLEIAETKDNSNDLFTEYKEGNQSFRRIAMEPIEELHECCPVDLPSTIGVITELTWAVSQLIAAHNKKIEEENDDG